MSALVILVDNYIGSAARVYWIYEYEYMFTKCHIPNLEMV